MTIARIAACLALAGVGCGGRGVERVAETSELDEVAVVRAMADGSALLLGAYEGRATAGRNPLFSRRARIARVAGDGRVSRVYDGEGTIIDASFAGERTGMALVRRIRPSEPDVARDFWILVTHDGGAHWAARTLPRLDELKLVELTDERHGWIVGYEGSLETQDCGESWTPVPAAPRPELHDNVLAHGRAQGAVAFEGGRLSVRDRQLGAVRTVTLPTGTDVQCMARLAPDRLVVVTSSEVRGAREKRAAAREVHLPDLRTTRALDGIPEDFVCGSASGGGGVALFAGALLGTGGALGISHTVFRFDASGAPAERIRVPSGADPIVALDGAPLVASAIVGTDRVELSRVR